MWSRKVSWELRDFDKYVIEDRHVLGREGVIFYTSSDQPRAGQPGPMCALLNARKEAIRGKGLSTGRDQALLTNCT